MMLIKTSEPNYVIEKMLKKSAQRRRLTSRQEREHNALQAVGATRMVNHMMQGTAVSNQVLHHAKLHAVPTKPRQGLSPGRISRDVPAVTRWNVFGDIFPS